MAVAAPTLSRVNAALAGGYSTTFWRTENPLSEGGLWKNGATDGTDWADIRTQAGLGAYGNQEPPTAPPYNDAGAVFNPLTKGDCRIIYQAGINEANRASWTGFHELEAWRGTIAAGEIKVYEAMTSLLPGNPYWQIMKWPGPIADNINDFLEVATVSNGPVINDRDWVRWDFIGPLIIGYFRQDGDPDWGDLVISGDTTSDGARYTSGKPGLGWWKNGNVVANTDYWFRKWTVYPL